MSGWLEVLREFWRLVWSLLVMLWKAACFLGTLTVTTIGLVMWFKWTLEGVWWVDVLSPTLNLFLVWLVGATAGAIAVIGLDRWSGARLRRERAEVAALRDVVKQQAELAVDYLARIEDAAALASLCASEDPKRLVDTLRQVAEDARAQRQKGTL